MPDILLISYIFPPHYGIGGRRWAKHASALTKLGYQIDVVTARNAYSKTSLWYNEIRHNSKITIHSLPAMYPKVLLRHNQSAIDKVLYKFWMSIWCALTKGSMFDRSLIWNYLMLSKSKKLIKKKNIKYVICSGGPYSAMYFSTKLKDKFPHITLINDLRDPWTWAPNWGFPGLSDRRMAEEKHREELTIKKSNYFTMPSQEMQNILVSKYSKYKEKLLLIPHFFDPDEITPNIKIESSKIRLVLYGTIYEGIENYLHEILKSLDTYNEQLSLHIYSDSSPLLANLVAKENVTLLPPVEPKKLFKSFEHFDYVLLINPEYNANNLSTKFFEIIYSRTPIFIASIPGRGPSFISDNRLGIHATCEQISFKLSPQVLSDFISQYNMGYNVENYSLTSITNLIHSLLTRSSEIPDREPDLKNKK